MKKKILALLLTVVMMFAMASVALAADTGEILYGDGLPGSGTPADQLSTYVIGEPNTADSVTVTLVVEAGNAISTYYEAVPDSAFRQVFSVTTSAAADTYAGQTVYDVLLAANKMSATTGTTFDFHQSSTTVYMDSVTHNNVVWTDHGQKFGLEGWEFCVNDLFPVDSYSNGDLTGYQGTSMENTPVHDGDVIHFYYNFPSDFDETTGNICANYIRGALQSYNNNTAVFIVEGFKQYIDQHDNFKMYVYKYTPAAGITAKLYDVDGNVVAEGISNSNGTVTFTNVSAGSYIFQTDSELYVFPEESEFSELIDDCFLKDTGAYSAAKI